jgi:hypothetical protein
MGTIPFNFEPLANMLIVEGFSLSEYADLLDELAYDYAQPMIELQVIDQMPKYCLHEKSAEFLFRLKELRDVFRKCNACNLLE